MSLSSSAKAALRQAEAEGLTLQRSESSNTGYKGVTFKSGKVKPYQAQVRRGGKDVHLGCFATAEEAALCVARTPEAQAAAAAPPARPPLTAEEALRQTEAEGLALLQSEGSITGFKGVSSSGSKSKPYKAYLSRGGKLVNLGYFATAEEAALCYARTPEARRALAAAAAPPAPPPMTAEEALRQAEAEGLTLLRSVSGGSTGYKGVSFDSSRKTRPYRAEAQRGGKVSLGLFATAQEAALVVARASAAQAAPPQPPATSSKKRKVKSEEKPPDMPTGARVKQEAPPVVATGTKRKLSERFKELKNCKAFMSAKQYAAKHAELMKEI